MSQNDESLPKLIIYDEVRERPFASPSMATASLVIAYFSDRVKPDGINSSNITKLNLDIEHITRIRNDDKRLFEEGTGVRAEEVNLESYYNEGIAVLTRDRDIPLSLVTDMELRLGDLGKSKVGYGVSSFAYKHLVFPRDVGEGLANAEISTHHVIDNVLFLTSVLDACKISRQIPRSEVFAAALSGTIVHEFGHALRTYVQIKMAEKVINEGGDGNKVRTIIDLLDIQNRGYFWELSDQISDDTSNAIMNNISNVSEAATALGRTRRVDHESLAGMTDESLAQGLEFYEIRKLMASKLTSDELTRFEQIFGELLVKKKDDYLFYLELCQQKGLSSENIVGFIDSIRRGYENAELKGITPWKDALPYYNYGLGTQQAGYYFPVPPENIGSCINQLLTKIETPIL